MKHRNMFIAALTLCAFSSAAHAYIGAGAGLFFLGELFVLLGGVLSALALVLLWPIRRLIKKYKARKTHHE